MITPAVRMSAPEIHGLFGKELLSRAGRAGCQANVTCRKFRSAVAAQAFISAEAILIWLFDLEAGVARVFYRPLENNQPCRKFAPTVRE
jgi:hypothetical protein